LQPDFYSHWRAVMPLNSPCCHEHWYHSDRAITAQWSAIPCGL